MESPELKKTEQAAESEHSRFLQIAATLVFLIGTPVFFSVVQAPPNFESQPGSMRTQSSATANAQDRKLASVESEETTGLLYELDCNAKPKNVTTKESHVRIVGVVCGKKDVTYKVKNETNGYTAAVIFSPGKQFTTDFVDLNPGENRIVVTDFTNDHQQKFSVTRVSTATN